MHQSEPKKEDQNNCIDEAGATLEQGQQSTSRQSNCTTKTNKEQDPKALPIMDTSSTSTKADDDEKEKEMSYLGHPKPGADYEPTSPPTSSTNMTTSQYSEAAMSSKTVGASRVRRSRFSETIPTELGNLALLRKLPLLRKLDLASTSKLTGTIPSELGRLSKLGKMPFFLSARQ
jgi:hypothetical protein